jgi:pyruvate formate lyase activating enzyme
MMNEASWYEKQADKKVRCRLCAHNCLISDQKAGICAVRKNEGGVLMSLVYDKVIAEHIDAIEKKPLYHFLPGSTSYSIATAGCNFTCLHCQNAEISQIPRNQAAITGRERTPEAIVSAALASGSASISYTYTEPTIYYELAYDTAKVAAENGLKNIFVTNGYINPEPLVAISPYLHAANIDLKGFSENFYHSVCGAKLKPVLDAIELYKKLGIWLEITTLVIPGLNDSSDMLKSIAAFIASAGVEIPWHVTAFHPTYLMTDKPQTPVQTLMLARTIGLSVGLRYVYTGNVSNMEGENTYCPACRNAVVKRCGFSITHYNLKNGQCLHCQANCDGVFSQESPLRTESQRAFL